MISFDIKHFEETCSKRPKGYREHVLSFGKIIEDRIWLKPEDHTYLSNYYRTNKPIDPRFFDSLENVAKAAARWVAAGFPVATNDVIQTRKAECEKCNFWDSKSRMGLGKCNHEKCGCTKLKWWLSTEKCPIGKW